MLRKLKADDALITNLARQCSIVLLFR
jgi:hypothetical protein